MDCGHKMEFALSLGSNEGNKLENMRMARTRISHIDSVKVVASSALYNTEPVDVPEEYSDKSFLNAVVIVDCTLEPDSLLQEVKSIELKMGRRHENSGGNLPRTIDIDIIYADNEVVAMDNIDIPHPRWYLRRFVVEPLADVRPEMILPGMKISVQEHLEKLSDKHNVKLFMKKW